MNKDRYIKPRFDGDFVPRRYIDTLQNEVNPLALRDLRSFTEAFKAHNGPESYIVSVPNDSATISMREHVTTDRIKILSKIDNDLYDVDSTEVTSDAVRYLAKLIDARIEYLMLRAIVPQQQRDDPTFDWRSVWRYGLEQSAPWWYYGSVIS